MTINNSNKTTREQIIDKLLAEHPIDDMVIFDESSIKEKLEFNTFEVIKYQELYYKEQNELDKILALRDKIAGVQYDYYRFKFDRDLKPNEIKDYYLPKDPQIIKINKILRQQQWRVDFFEMCYKALNSMGWNMKSYLQAIQKGF